MCLKYRLHKTALKLSKKKKYCVNAEQMADRQRFVDLQVAATFYTGTKNGCG